jgi:hypothetical protein
MFHVQEIGHVAKYRGFKISDFVHEENALVDPFGAKVDSTESLPEHSTSVVDVLDVVESVAPFIASHG